MPVGLKPLEHGIIPVIGPPGMGKSYLSVHLIKRYIIKEKRPVYTNVPVVLKSMRAYIYMHAKGTKAYKRALCRLVRPMTQGHFQRFSDRMEKVNKLAEKIMDANKSGNDLEEATDFEQHTAREEATRQVDEQTPRIYTGGGSNMVPPGTVLILDEVHHWYPSRDYRNEPDSIMHLTSMHRHYMLRMYVLSQRLMNISLTFRAMASDYIFCVNLSKIPLLGPLRLHRVFNWFLYSHYDGGSVSVDKGQVEPGAKPYIREYHLPELSNKQVYRCYRSYSHAGKIEDLYDELDEARAKMIGTEAAEELKDKRTKKVLGTRDNPKGIRLWFHRLVIFVFIAGVFWNLGKCAQRPAELPELLEPAEPAQSLEGPDAADQRPASNPTEAVTDTLWETTTLTAVKSGGVNIGRRFIPLGARYEKRSLIAIDTSRGDSVWIDDDGHVWRWGVGGLPARGVLPPAIAAELGRAFKPDAPDEPAGDQPATD